VQSLNFPGSSNLALVAVLRITAADAALDASLALAARIILATIDSAVDLL